MATAAGQLTPHMTRACATCPWRKSNLGKPHPNKWYTLANLRRLWNGLRWGKAPGMTCHGTDPRTDVRGERPVENWTKVKECAGALLLVTREIKHLEANKHYLKWRPKNARLSRRGGMVWVERIMFGGGIPALDEDPDIQLPEEFLR